jgi:hypothetical protein
MDQEPVVVVVASTEPKTVEMSPSQTAPEIVAAAAAASAAAGQQVGMELGLILSRMEAQDQKINQTLECVQRVEAQIGPMQECLDIAGQMMQEAEVEIVAETEPVKPAAVSATVTEVEVKETEPAKPNPDLPAPKKPNNLLRRMFLGA